MRNLIATLLLIAPASALAQTPKDIAAQVWPQGAPAYAGQPPVNQAPRSFTPADLARQVGPFGAASRAVAPSRGQMLVSGMTGADLARLLAGPSLSVAHDEAMRVARAEMAPVDGF